MKLYLGTLLFIFPIIGFAQLKVGTNPTSLDSSAVLHLESTNKGVILPRMTTAQRTAITFPAKGLIVYDSTLHNIWFYNGSSWNGFDNSLDAFRNNALQQRVELNTLADGVSGRGWKQGIVIRDNGFLGLADTLPTYRLSVNSDTIGKSGVRLMQLKSTDAAAAATSAPLGVNQLGEVVRVSSLQASIASSRTATTSVSTTATAIPFDTDGISVNGAIAHSTSVNNSRFTVQRNGRYNVLVIAQVERLSNTSNPCIIWLRINGTTNVSNSAVRYMPSNNNEASTLTLNTTIDLSANDYIEVMLYTAGSTGDYQLTYNPSSTTPSIPATPACRIDIKGYFQ